MLPIFTLLALLALASGQAVSPFSRKEMPDGSTFYNEIILAAAAANNRAYNHHNQHNNSSNHSNNSNMTAGSSPTEDLANVLQHFDSFYNVTTFIRKMTQLTNLENEYLRTQLTTQMNTHQLNRTMFTTNQFPECVAQLKNRSRGIVDTANEAMKQCERLYSNEEVADQGVKFKLMSKDQYERFRECTKNITEPGGSEAPTPQVADCVNFTMTEQHEELEPKQSQCWSDFFQGAGEVERMLRLTLAQTETCIALVRMRQELHGQQRTEREVPESSVSEQPSSETHARQRRWRTIT